ncbi:MAG TPA: ATP synthase F1 subunit gamma [Dehalococcoidia bacterium]|nr:ATP synthase F1 subunit gamma [Dehalococcoidia bacterium]
MPTLRQINRRIRSVQSTAKTTRAMSLVAGSKMRRAQQMALAQRPYAEQLHSLLTHVVESLQSEAAEGGALHPLLERREIKTHGLLLMTPDRGLCGGLNTNLLRVAGGFVTRHANTKFIGVGRKGVDFFRRSTMVRLGEFTNLGDYPSYDQILPIARLVMDAYTSGEVDAVSIVYPNFINTVVQRPTELELLPVTLPEADERKKVEYIYEPSPREVLSVLMPRYVEVEIYRAVLELAASYQSAQMVAMRNATDAALELIGGLTLLRNKVRQEQITKELLDITGGVEAMTAARG